MSLSNKLSITDVDLKGKRVLIRVSSLSRTSRCCDTGRIQQEVLLEIPADQYQAPRACYSVLMTIAALLL